eukprot:Lankesteria_metandrocarpae@DN4411_c0_g1_i1.p1
MMSEGVALADSQVLSRIVNLLSTNENAIPDDLTEAVMATAGCSTEDLCAVRLTSAAAQLAFEKILQTASARADKQYPVSSLYVPLCASCMCHCVQVVCATVCK